MCLFCFLCLTDESDSKSWALDEWGLVEIDAIYFSSSLVVAFNIIKFELWLLQRSSFWVRPTSANGIIFESALKLSCGNFSTVAYFYLALPLAFFLEVRRHSSMISFTCFCTKNWTALVNLWELMTSSEKTSIDMEGRLHRPKLWLNRSSSGPLCTVLDQTLLMNCKDTFMMLQFLASETVWSVAAAATSAALANSVLLLASSMQFISAVIILFINFWDKRLTEMPIMSSVMSILAFKGKI